MLHVTDDHRRARIARRHGLAPDHRYTSPENAATAMTVLHATETSTPFLSLHARVRELTVADVEALLYDERSLIRVMAMRRTLFIVPRNLLPAVAGSAGRRVAEAERRRLAKEAVELDEQLGANWIATASAEIVEHLSGREVSTPDLRSELAHLGGTFTAAPGTKWSAEVPMMSRLLTILTASGDIVRARNAGHWRISKPTYTSMATWLGSPMTPTEAQPGYADVVRRWLWTFGPGTEADIVWWLGSTKSTVRKALADVDAVPVELDDGTVAWVLPDDLADLESPPQTEPWVALLPTLDPTVMGWRERAFYLDPAHTPYLFDSVGNAGTTVWVNGRIVGCWVQDDKERVQLVLIEDVSSTARALLDVEVARLDDFLGGEHISNVFTSPQMKRQPLR